MKKQHNSAVFATPRCFRGLHFSGYWKCIRIRFQTSCLSGLRLRMYLPDSTFPCMMYKGAAFFKENLRIIT